MKQKLQLNSLRLGLVCTILSMYFNTSYCQDNSVWFEEGTKWFYTYLESAEIPYKGYFKMEVVGDTIISDSTYQIVQSLLVHSNGDSSYLKNEYFRYSEHLDAVFQYFDYQDNLLYDFSAEVMDTILVPYNLWSGTITISMVVDSVSVEEFPGQIIRRVQYIRVIDPLDYYMGRKVVEGIGALSFFIPINSFDCDAGCAGLIRCYSDSELSVNFQPSINCTTLINHIDYKEKLDYTSRIYPNPTSELIQIASIQQISSVTIVCMRGREILNTQYSGIRDVHIDVSFLHSGLYFLMIEYEDGCFETQKVVIE